jgi:hypothetical protein
MTKRGTTSTNPGTSTKRVKRGPTDEEEGEESRPTVVILHENWDKDRLVSISHLAGLGPEVERSVFDLLKTRHTEGEMQPVHYAYAKGMTLGRLYAKNPSLQRVLGKVARNVSHPFYHDFDVVNAAPTIASQIAVQKLGKCPTMLTLYVTDRESLFKACQETHPQFTDKQLKKLFLVGLHGGTHTSPDVLEELNIPFADWPTIAQPIPTLHQWEQAVKKMADRLWRHADYAELRKTIFEDATKTNKLGTFIAYVWQTVESEIIQELLSFFTRAGHRVGVLSFDGLMVEQGLAGQSSPVSLLRDAEKHVQNVNGFSIKLAEKPLTPGDKDLAFYFGPKVLHKLPGPYRKCEYVVSHEAQLGDFKRVGDLVFEPHKIIPGVYIQKEKALDFMNRLLRGYQFAKVPLMMDKMMKWFESTDCDRFPRLTESSFRRDVVSFTDGFLDMKTLMFNLWSEWTGPVPITDHYFEKELKSILETPGGAKTPLWDGMLLCQITEDQKEILEILIGRLFYDVGAHDNWQVMPFLQGDAGTGKSTILDLVGSMFPLGSAGCIGSRTEAKFGLDAFYEKRHVQFPDVPHNLSSVLTSTDFQSMVSGETMSMARKFKRVPIVAKWTAPLIMAGNVYPDFADKQGSVSRRIVMFAFEQHVKKADTRLRDNILEGELVAVMVRCIAAYRKKAETEKTDLFWDWAPPGLRENKETLKLAIDPLAEFIANGDDFHQILHAPGNRTTLTAINMAYSKHMENVHKIRDAKIGNNHYAILAAGFTKKRIYICKVCHEISSKGNCGDHYNGDKNRSKIWVFEDMLIQRRLGGAHSIEPIY